MWDFPAHDIRPALMGRSPVRLCFASQIRSPRPPTHTHPPKRWGRQTAAPGDAVLNTTSWGTPGFGAHLVAFDMCRPGPIRGRER